MTIRATDPQTEIYLPKKDSAARGELSVDIAREEVAYPIHLRREGFKTDRRIIVAKNFPSTVFLLLTGDVAVTSLPLFFESSRKKVNTGLLVIGSLSAAAIDATAARWKLYDYPDPYDLSMKRNSIPYRDRPLTRFELSSLSFDLPEMDTILIAYRTPFNFHERSVEDAQDIDLFGPSDKIDFDIAAPINKMLQKKDSSEVKNTSREAEMHELGLDLEAEDLHFHFTDYSGMNLVSAELQLDIELKGDYGSKVLADSTMRVESGTFYNEETLISEVYKELESDIFKEPFSDAVKSSILQFLNSEEVKKKIEQEKMKIEKSNERSPLDLPSADSIDRGGKGSLSKRVVTLGESELGSGCIVSPSGHILTDLNNVVGKDTIQVYLQDGREMKAHSLLQDRKTNMALIKLKASDLPFFKVEKGSMTQPGSDVIAIGTSVEKALGHSVTRGIISGKTEHRGEEHLMTDAPLTPQHRGGALIDVDSGQLIGIIKEGEFSAIAVDEVYQALRISYGKE